MIKKEYLRTRKDGKKLYKSFSDEGFRILQVETNNIFDEAIDVEGINFTYEETSEKIKNEDEETEICSEKILN